MTESSKAQRVSIVIPCFNQGQYLGRSIESATHQALPPDEIIVVDDGSSDNTAKVSALYPGVMYIRQENQGVSVARNNGWRASHGDYVLFLDADDMLTPDALAAGVRALEQHPDWAFVSGDYRECDENGSVTFDGSSFTEIVGDSYAALLRHNHITVPAVVLYRREILERVHGFDPTAQPSEDYDINLRIARQFPVGQVRQVMALYRQHGSNVSHDFKRMLLGVYKAMERQQPYLRDDPQRRRAYRAGVRLNCGNFCYLLLRQSLQRLKESKTRRRGLDGIFFLIAHPRWLWAIVWNERFFRKLAASMRPFVL